MNAFTIRLDFGDERYSVDYDSPTVALRDHALRLLMHDKAVASVWFGSVRITRDLRSWEALKSQLVANATTLLRMTGRDA